MSNNPFMNDKDTYIQSNDPFMEYINQGARLLTKFNGKSFGENIDRVKNILKSGNYKNPIVTMNVRDDVGDWKTVKTSLKEYMDYPKKNNKIITPSFTVYENPKIKKSLHSEFTDVNKKDRSKYKKKALMARVSGDFSNSTTGFKYNNTMQKTKKVKNNALSGAYGSTGTILYNPSAHYTLTSITRCLSGLGNTLSEIMIAGNRSYFKPEDVVNNIATILNNIDRQMIRGIINKYNLYIPNTDDLLNIVRFSLDKYVRNDNYINKIKELLDKLTEEERVAFAYINDLKHLRDYNDNVIRGFISKLSAKVRLESDNPANEYLNSPEWVTNLISHIFIKELKGIKLTKDELIKDPELCKWLDGTSLNIQNTIKEYSDLINVFFKSKIQPINIAMIYEQMRETVPLSDTDSTCAAYDEWTKWYYGTYKFTLESAAITASVMTIVTNIIKHFILAFYVNMNIPKYQYGKLDMKNEFFWIGFINANTSKHYYSLPLVQEGGVLDIDYNDINSVIRYLEIKGVHLLANKVNQEVREVGLKIMASILMDIMNGKEISVYNYAKTVADLERKIETDVLEHNKVDYFKNEKVKDKNSYTTEPEKSPYFNYIVWNEIFKDKYGEIDKPPYAAVKVSLDIETRKQMLDYIDSIENEQIRNNFLKVLEKYKKDKISTFLLPLSYAFENGIPEELKQKLHIKKLIKDNCNGLYIILETLGVFVKPGLNLKDVGY